MIVTNLTDAPGHLKGPTQVDIYNKTLSPGDHIKLPADLVDKKIRSLAEGDTPLISIGNLPPWYVAAKKRKGKPLTAEERQKMQTVAPPPPVIQLKPSKETTKEKVSEVTEEVSRKSNRG